MPVTRLPLLFLLGVAFASAAPRLSADTCDFSAVDQRVGQLLAQAGVSDGAVLVGSAGGILHKVYFGTYSDASVVPIASATKLLSGVRIAQLAGQGVLALDAPVSSYLNGSMFPWNAANHTGDITLRQMFSHTAGYGNDDDDPILGAPSITLEQSVGLIASDYMGYSPQDFLPAGSQFAYGGVSMQIGGEVAQMQTGVDWEQGWKASIGAPLCINSIDWQGLGATANYRIAGGAQSSLDDYARVLAMLLADGVGNGTRILSIDAVAALIHSQTGTASAGFIPAAEGDNTQYGIGAWIEPISVSVDAPTISSIGKFGFTPWVDYSSATFGVVMLYSPTAAGVDNPASVYAHAAMNDIITRVRTELQANGTCALRAVYDNVFAQNFDAAPPAPNCPGIVEVP